VGLDLLQVARRHFAGSPDPVFVVGGWVRDALLGRASADMDLVVESGAWVRARRIAAGSGGSFVGLDRERDYARVVWPASGRTQYILDIAPYQGDDLRADLASRDFTVNALACPLEVDDAAIRESVVDPTGGLQDLSSGIIRMTSDAVFDADPLRLLRAPRLAVELGFAIDPATRGRIEAQAHLVRLPAGERIRDELMRLLDGGRATLGAELLWDLGLWQELSAAGPAVGIRPDGSRPAEGDALWVEPTALIEALEALVRLCGGVDEAAGVPDEVVEAISGVTDDLAAHLDSRTLGGYRRLAWLCLTALIAAESKADSARLIERLRLSRAEATYVATVVAQRALPYEAKPGSRRDAYRFYRAVGAAGVDVILLALAKNSAGVDEDPGRGWPAVARGLLETWFHAYDEVVAPRPLVDGEDLKSELGLTAGPEIGRLLDVVREAQAAGDIADREQALELARRTHDER
jgi:tRNA nucleotidyltransferase/poly(A) polymerase